MDYQSGVVSPVESVKNGWNIISSNYWMYVLMIFVAGAIIIVAALILGAINSGITLAIVAATGGLSKDPNEWQQVSSSIVVQIVSLITGFFINIIILTLSGALSCGIYSALTRTASTGTIEFGDLFSGFQKIRECFIISILMAAIELVIGIIMLGISAAFGISAFGLGSLIMRDGKPNPEIFGGLFLIILAIAGINLVVRLVIAVLTMFVYPLIANRNLSGIEALKASIQAGAANFGGLLLLLILLGLMTFGGLLACVIGVLFVAPLLTAATFSAYQSIFGAQNGYYQSNPPPPPTFGGQSSY